MRFSWVVATPVVTTAASPPTRIPSPFAVRPRGWLRAAQRRHAHAEKYQKPRLTGRLATGTPGRRRRIALYLSAPGGESLHGRELPPQSAPFRRRRASRWPRPTRRAVLQAFPLSGRPDLNRRPPAPKAVARPRIRVNTGLNTGILAHFASYPRLVWCTAGVQSSLRPCRSCFAKRGRT